MKIKGVAIAPGVSKNGRYYSADMIRKAVEQAQPRVAAGQMIMKAHHDAPDTLGVVGRITTLRVAEDGSAAFEGELADTSTARDVGALIRGKAPFISGVSIAGSWQGQTRNVKIGTQTATTADGLHLESLDFTATPGVTGAHVLAESTGRDKRLIYEEAGPVEAVPAEPDARALASMTTEEFNAVADAQWTRYFAGADERRAATPPPFRRGLSNEER